MATKLDKPSIFAAYEEVRQDDSDITWAVFKYEGKDLKTTATGSEFDQFRSHFADDDRGFGFVRVVTGDELSRRAKFALVTWVGSQVSAMKRAKTGADKQLVKTVVQSFAIEVHTSDADELTENYIKDAAIKAGGANYGTGSRD